MSLFLLYLRFYSYHYAPFGSGFSNLENIVIDFNKNSKPLKPLEELMAIFPPYYARYLPSK
jgi:5'-3' exonuclease